MFFQPDGSTVTSAQARTLDDELLGSRPMQFFHSRIEAILNYADPDFSPTDHDMRRAFSKLVGERDHPRGDEAPDRKAQVAMEAFAVRHHAAEALLRVFHAVAIAEQEPACVWVRLTDGPIRGKELVDAVLDYLDSDAAHSTAWSFILPLGVAQAAGQEAADMNLRTAVAWIRRAARLLVQDDIDLNGAYNKVKHGMAVRARGDHRMMLLMTAPGRPHGLPGSAFEGNNAVGVFTEVTMQVLTRPASEGGGRNAALEVTNLHLIPEKLLAETWMLANVLGAVFHTAASTHLRRHPPTAADDPPPGSPPGRHLPKLPPFPALPLGPTPASLLGDEFLGLRSSVTHRRDGSIGRGTSFVTEQSYMDVTVDMSSAMRGRVVDN